MRDPLDSFRDLPEAADDRYPGSKMERRAVSGRAPSSSWDKVPHKVLWLRGVPTRFYTIGVLASRLGRQVATLRKWERQGYLPQTDWRSPGETEHGQKRLYTREQIEGVVRIAHEEGVTDGRNRNVGNTQFKARVATLFEALQR